MTKLSRIGFMKLLSVAALALLPVPVLAKGRKPKKWKKPRKKPKKPKKQHKDTKKPKLTSRLQCGDSKCRK